ncbi:hypothetical protein A9Q87_01270 [Flavobacteriales bacterium 34_180_T64]|nr:hypothetical protein A9Q87_01270 [Flavobacteriales bacterium 34_180_T64]
METLLIQIKKIVVVTLLLSVTSLFAQTPEHQYNFDGPVKWMLLHESGTLIASTGEALVGIKSNKAELHFKLDRLKKVKEENLELVPGTPYLIVKPKGMLNQGHVSVVDVVKGKIVFDTRAEDWQGGATSRHFISPEMMLVVNGMHRDKGKGEYTQGVGLYDLKTGELVKIFERKASNAMVGVPDIKGNTIIIPGLKNVKAYDISSGSETWTADVKNATRISSNDETNEIYAFRTKGGNTVVYKIDGSSGTLKWSDGNKLKGNLARYEFTKGGLAVVTNVDNSGKKGLGKMASSKSASKIFMLDTNSGVDLWDKSPKTKGYVSHFYIEDDGILFAVASGGVNKISFDGKAQWKKPLKTGANIQLMARVPKGVIYISESSADIIDMSSGESVFGKPIKYKKSTAVANAIDKDRNRFLLSCKDGIYEIDGDTGTYNLMNSEINFDGKEVPSHMEVRADKILLTSDQNLMWLDFDGSESDHVYHRAPGKSAFGAILVGALTAASAAATISHSAQAGYLKGAGVPSYNSTVSFHESQAESWANVTDAGFQEMAKRFKATKATENSAFILTKIDGGVGLVKVDKDSGKTLKEILVKDKDPMYEVDEFEGVLYFKAKGNTIHAYNLKD